MSRLFNRTWRVRVAGRFDAGSTSETLLIDVSQLDIEFNVEKTLRPEPNKCKLTIYNLSQDNRQAIEALNLYDPKRLPGQKKKKAPAGVKNAPRAPKVGHIRVEIEAGYGEFRTLIFRGDLRRAISSRKGGDWVTEIEGEDGGRTVLSSRIRESFPPGTRLLTVVRACAESMGVGTGNLIEVSDVLNARVFTHGTTCCGSACDELKGLLRGAGVSYSIQNGVLQFRDSTPLVTNAVVLNQNTGLVGDPERDPAGTVKATSLMNPALSIGGHVKLESKAYNGTFQVVAIEYDGSTFGDEWYAHLELKNA